MNEMKPRISKVCKLLCEEGLSNKELSERTGLRVKTIKFYIGEALADQGVKTRSELIVKYWKFKMNEAAAKVCCESVSGEEKCLPSLPRSAL